MATRSFWPIAATIAAVAFAVLAGFGWYEAVQRGNAKSTVEVALNVEKQQRHALQQQVVALQQDLAKARESEQALRSQKLDVQASLSANEAQSSEVDALKQRADKAEQAQAAAQARVRELETAVAQAKAQAAPAPSPGPAATANAKVSPTLPSPDLPPGATSRDYLVAAQQAIRENKPGLARAALGRAEVRLLNRLSNAGKLPPLGKHPGVSEIEQVLDSLGQNDKQAALNALDDLLKQDSAAN